MEFWKKYRHIGYSYGAVGKGWKPIVEKALIDIEKEMWPKWMPKFLCRWIHFFATGNSSVNVKYFWAHRLRDKLTDRQIITDVKEKFAGLRIYAFAGKEINEIIKRATKECDETCENCGSKNDVQLTNTSWIHNYCAECRYVNIIND